MDTKIKLTCTECHRPNSVPYGRGFHICSICSGRELRAYKRKQIQSRIQTIGGFVVIVLAVWTACIMASDWDTPNSADHRVHQAMQARD